jgi:hypothetical protein
MSENGSLLYSAWRNLLPIEFVIVAVAIAAAVVADLY